MEKKEFILKLGDNDYLKAIVADLFFNQQAIIAKDIQNEQKKKGRPKSCR